MVMYLNSKITIGTEVLISTSGLLSTSLSSINDDLEDELIIYLDRWLNITVTILNSVQQRWPYFAVNFFNVA